MVKQIIKKKQRINNYLKNRNSRVTNYLRVGIISILSVVIGFIGVIYFSTTFPIITAYFGIIGNVGLGIGVWYIIDRYVLRNVNTIEEIEKGNIAYSILALSIMILIAAAILAT